MEIEEKFTPGVTTFFQGQGNTHPLFKVASGIPCQSAREQASEILSYVHEMTLDGLMDERPYLIWASHYLSAFAKALLDDAELGTLRSTKT